jgi:hypothetical protein
MTSDLVLELKNQTASRRSGFGAAHCDWPDFAGRFCCQNEKTSFHQAGDCPAMSLWWAPGMI